MTRMQIQEFTFCPHHQRGLIVLEAEAHRMTLAFGVHPDEAPRLARMLKGSPLVIHPLYDFVQALLDAFLVTPTDVVLDDVPGKGLMAFVQVQRSGTMHSLPCYAPDALAFGVHKNIPIYATNRALMQAESRAPKPELPVKDSDEEVRAWIAHIKPTDF